MQKLCSGSCEKADSCEAANAKCRTAVFAETMVCAPERRWMYCSAWKQHLGLEFDKDLGVHILKTCPYCHADLKYYMSEAAKK